MSGGFAVLVNPQAGLTPADTSVLDKVVGTRGFVAEAGTGAGLAEQVERIRRERIEVVCVCGGDGTLGRVATALEGEYGGREFPAIAPIGGGTMNTIARSLGLRRSRPAEALGRVLGGGGDVVRIRQGTMRINDDRLGFMFGAGVPARFLQIYEASDQLGPVRAARVLGSLIASAVVGGKTVRELFSAVEGMVHLDGRDVGLRRISMVYAAVIDDIGLGFRPTPRARKQAGHFEVLAADARAWDLLRALPRLRFGDGIGGAPWVDECGKRLSIQLDGAVAYMVDGDVEDPVDNLEVGAGPEIAMIIARG